MFPEYTIYFDLPDWPTLFELPLHQEEVSEISRESDLKTPYLKMSLDQDTLLEWFLGFEDFRASLKTIFQLKYLDNLLYYGTVYYM